MSAAARPARLLFAGGPIRPVAGPDLPEAVVGPLTVAGSCVIALAWAFRVRRRSVAAAPVLAGSATAAAAATELA